MAMPAAQADYVRGFIRALIFTLSVEGAGRPLDNFEGSPAEWR